MVEKTVTTGSPDIFSNETYNPFVRVVKGIFVSSNCLFSP